MKRHPRSQLLFELLKKVFRLVVFLTQKFLQQMKKLFLILAIVGVMMSGCKKDGIFCEGVNCLNGGSCKGGVCDCPAGFSGEFCENDNRPACEKNNTGTVLISNNTNDDWNIYANGVYVGWAYEWSVFSFTIQSGNKNIVYVQTDFVFTAEEKYGSVDVAKCASRTIYIN